ncbi:Uncharacterised protein [uncultured archaeon]|nr:Uncharacterised protein [uncultured archaeon]
MSQANRITMISAVVALIALLSENAYAHCPLCTGAIGVGAVAATALGVDVSVVGIFVGAFAVSTGLWLGRRLKNRYIPFQTAAIVIASFLLTVVPVESVVPQNIYLPMLYFGSPGSIFNRVWWMPKMLFGSIIGGVLTVGGLYLHEFLKKRNNGHVYFQFQGVILTVGLLILSSVVLFLAMKGTM